ncbi:Acyl-[acyl-carrier-protein]--UDP-N-acetylglucosamine O-acyltransferase [compost metagenome]
MAYAHVAHDCQVGDHTVFANNAQLAGHVHVGDYAILGGFTAVHQFCSIGAHTITGLGTVVLQDIPPYVRASGNSARPYGINAKGLRRHGFSPESISGLKRAYRTLYRLGLGLEEAVRELERQLVSCPEIHPLLEFLAASTRGIIR